MVELKPRPFSEASAHALGDSQLQESLRKVGGGFDAARLEAIDELGPERWEELRIRAREIKQNAIENLDYWLEMVYDRVTANGGHVHFAADGKEANDIVTGLARSKGVKLATKSKSMVSEETGLNGALEQAGVEVVETDLGEYIIQLAEETPFHIIAPAMHKTRRQVSSLFEENGVASGLTDIEDMARAAREALRGKLLTADMGITGANFLVAETGTVVIVTNEGNGRFCTSAPRIHVALTGMEKVVPSLDDLPVFLRLLPRAATGQRLTSYVSMISGPRRSDDEDGPDEFHLVIVDNGRTRLLADPDLRESLYCIRCGACLNVCPVYRKVGGHAYGWVYPGPIGAVISPVLTESKSGMDLPFASSLCGACREACPVKINLPRMLLHLRAKASTPGPQHRASLWERLTARGFTQIMKRPRLYSLAGPLMRLAQSPFSRGGRIRSIPMPPLSKWTKSRDLPAFKPKSFRDIWKQSLSTPEAPDDPKGRPAG